MSGPDGTKSYEYDYKGRIKKTTYGNNATVENLFDENLRTKTVKLNGNTLFVLNLDREGRAAGSSAVVEQASGGNNVFGIERYEMGRIEEVDYPNRDKSLTTYDTEGRIITQKNYYKNQLLNKFMYDKPGYLDGEGNRMKEDTSTGTKVYGYDNTYQLTSANYEKSQQSFSWAYDAAGNRLSSVETGLVTDSKTYTSYAQKAKRQSCCCLSGYAGKAVD